MIDRRDFMKIGGVAASFGLTKFSFADNKLPTEVLSSEKSIVWVWLGGGPSQFETFNAPKEGGGSAFQTVGNIIATGEGHRLGGLWEKLAEQSDKFTTVNSFGHRDSAHRQATFYMMNGKYHTERTQTAVQTEPSHGSIVSAIYGANDHRGMPTYVNQNRIDGEDGGWLGGAYKPFNPSRKANLIPQIDLDRMNNRMDLLKQLDRELVNAEIVGEMQGQAYNTIRGQIYKAFDTSLEPSVMSDKYGKGIGQQFLLARRLIEAGTKFITINYDGWDMHSNIDQALKGRVPPIDHALSVFIEDIWNRGLEKDTLLIVTGEFGRTKLNAGSGRDHWSACTPLLLSGGKYTEGRTIGSADKSYTPSSDPYGPSDLKATIFDHFGILNDVQRTDTGGRPRYLLEEGKVIV